MRTLVLAEHDGKALCAVTKNAVAAAALLGAPIDVLVVAHEDAEQIAARTAVISGVAQVYAVEGPHYIGATAENVACLLASIAKDYTHVIGVASTTGKNVLPRTAALLDVTQISDVVAIEALDTYIRPIYAGSVMCRVRCKEAIQLLTIRPSAFPALAAEQPAVPIKVLPPGPDLGLARFISNSIKESERPDLSDARIIVSGGRGLGSSENYWTVLEPLADMLGASLGASRAAVDAGYAPNDFQVGQTGRIVAPQVYIAVGLSGAIQHLAGMKDSKIIISVNKDPDAPIHAVADYRIVDDLFNVIPDLVQQVKSARTI